MRLPRAFLLVPLLPAACLTLGCKEPPKGLVLPEFDPDAGSPASTKPTTPAAEPSADSSAEASPVAAPESHATATLALADSVDAALEWAGASERARSSMKGVVERVRLNQPVYVGIALEGFELPESRVVDVSADLAVVDSSGEPVFERVSAAVGREIDPERPDRVVLKPPPQVKLDPTMRPGTYTARVKVWDQVRGVSTRAELAFEVTGEAAKTKPARGSRR